MEKVKRIVGPRLRPYEWELEIALVKRWDRKIRKELATVFFGSKEDALTFMGRIYGIRPKASLVGLKGWFPRPVLRCAKHRKAASRLAQKR